MEAFQKKEPSEMRVLFFITAKEGKIPKHSVTLFQALTGIFCRKT